MEDRKDTRRRIIETARRLFHERGYNATGLAEILKAAEVGSGSLYHFFRSKEELLSAVLDWYIEMLYPGVMDPAFATTDDPLDRVVAVLTGYREMLLMTDFNLGCPIGNLALEVGPAASQPVREKIARNFANWCKALETCLDAAADRLPSGLDRAGLSRFALTVMEGGIMQARAHRSIEYYDASVAQFRDYLNRLMADAKRENKNPAASTDARSSQSMGGATDVQST